MNQKLENRGDFLLKKWLEGSITWQEERELEQLAKGDAMLADALSGYQAMPEKNHVKQIGNIKARLQERIERKRRGLIFYLPRVAAAAAVIGALAFGIQYFVRNETGQPKVAAIEQQATKDQQQETERSISPETAAANIAEDSNQTLALQESKTKLPVLKKLVPAAPPIDNTKIAETADAPAVETEKPIADLSQMERANASEEMRTLQKPEMARSVTPNTFLLIERIITGKLTNVKGEPLIGVVVSVDGKDTGTTTGFDGHFSIPIPAETKELVFSYTGFQTTAVPIGKNDTVTVQLKEDAQALSEVVVSGYAVEQKIPAPKKTGENNDPNAPKMRSELSIGPPQPQPHGGFDKLKMYIQKNLRYPKAAQEAGIEGEVVVAFQISPNGKLSEFKIMKSLGYGCDEEAIRLLKEGPRWEMANSLKAKEVAAYVIEFKLKN